ncbi:MAG: PleD family two-component system response regulator [Anaerolineae bacterium]
MSEIPKTVLIVEDSPSQALKLKYRLERENLQVFWAHDGHAGVDMALQLLPDVIVLDVEMPEMDGFEACRQIKADDRTSNIPVIMLTVHAEPKVVRELLTRGAIDFIPKDDFSIEVLLETLRQLNILGVTRTTGDASIPGGEADPISDDIS